MKVKRGKSWGKMAKAPKRTTNNSANCRKIRRTARAKGLR